MTRKITRSSDSQSVFRRMGEVGWRDMVGSIASGRVAGANVPTWSVFRGSIYGYKFSASSTNEVWTVLHVNHDYKPGSALYPHIHWSPDTINTGIVRWGLEYCIAKGHSQEAFPAPTTIYIESTISTNSQYLHVISEVGDSESISSSSIEVDSLIMLRVFRDGAHANDTFPDAVFGWFVDIHYNSDRLSTPNKAPNFYG